MLKRRNFLALSSGIVASALTLGHSWRNPAHASNSPARFIGPQWPESVRRKVITENKIPALNIDLYPDNNIVDNIASVPPNVLDQLFPEIVLSEDEIKIFNKTLSRFSRLQKYIGYGNFNVIGWDQSLKFARNYNQIGKFSRAELEFVEKLFAIDANTLGFYGDKVVTRLSSSILKKDIRKIPGTGHYLFRASVVACPAVALLLGGCARRRTDTAGPRAVGVRNAPHLDQSYSPTASSHSCTT